MRIIRLVGSRIWRQGLKSLRLDQRDFEPRPERLQSMVFRILDNGRDQGICVLGEHLDAGVHPGRVLIVGMIGLDRRQLDDLVCEARRQLSDRIGLAVTAAPCVANAIDGLFDRRGDPDYDPGPDAEIEIFGVVTNTVRRFRR